MTTLADFLQISRVYHDALAALSAAPSRDFAQDLRAHFAPVFDADPSVAAIVWGQWAPYFNDGAPCRFSLSHESRLCRTTVESDPDPWSPEGEADEYWDRSHPQDAEAERLLEGLPLVYLEEICPDGVIQVCRDGRLVIRDFDHS